MWQRMYLQCSGFRGYGHDFPQYREVGENQGLRRQGSFPEVDLLLPGPHLPATAIRSLMEKCTEYNVSLRLVCVHYSKNRFKIYKIT